jgi:hypothetical protein
MHGEGGVPLNKGGSFPIEVKGVVTLLDKSKKHGIAVLHMTCEGQSDQGHASSDTHSHGVGECPSRLNQQSHDIL